ncbi:MAG: hypothetical protein WA924_15285 [Burkholderiaceae bacterium]
MTLVLVACGGGTGSGAGGDGNGTGELTPQRRHIATGMVAAQYETLRAANDPQVWEKLRDYVLTQPEFTEAGLGDDLLWARFSDGRYFMYLDNWKEVDADAAPMVLPAGGHARTGALDAAGAAVRVAPQLAPAPKAAAAAELPSSKRAAFLRMNQDMFNPGDQAIRQAAAALSRHGWTIDTRRELTLENVKNLGQLGLLYMTSHSGVYTRGDRQVFAVVVNDRATDENEVLYADELRDGAVIYTRTRRLWQEYGLGLLPLYAFTERFAQKHIRMSSHSLVVLMMCNSASDHTAPFHTALKAGTVIGWNGNSNQHGFEMIERLFDRLTGANVVAPQQVPNRPFVFNDVWTYLEQQGLLMTPGAEGDPPSFVKRIGDGFSMLVPVMHELETFGRDKLAIHGEFGTQPGTVRMDGELLAATWAPDGTRIDVDLGPGRHGRVVVTARDLSSNARVLGSWRGKVRYRQGSQEVGGCNTLFYQTVDVDLHLRADAHPVRTKVDGALLNSRRLAVPASDTRAQWRVDGECIEDGTPLLRWQGSGAFEFVPPPQGDDDSDPATGSVLTTRIDPVDRRFQLSGVLGVNQMFTETSTVITTQTKQRPLKFDHRLMGFYNNGPDYTYLLPWGTFLRLDPGANILAGQHQQADPQSRRQMVIEWSEMAMSPAFDPDIGR